MKIVSLANHFPSRDPRVLWSAETLSKKADVTIVGKVEPGYKLTDMVSPNFDVLLISNEEKIRAGSIIQLISLYKAQSFFIVSIGLVVSPLIIVWYLFGKLGLNGRAKKNRVIHKVITSLKTSDAFSSSLLIWRMILFSVRSFSIVQSLIKKGETVSWLANDLDTLLSAIILKRCFGGTLVYDMHEFWPYVTSRKNHHIFRLEKRLIKHVDAFITVSPDLRDEIKHQYKIEDDFFVVPNACPLTDTAPGLSVQDASIQLNTSDINFLFQGGFAPERGLEFLIDSWAHKQIPVHCKLWLRGSENHYKDSLLTRLKNLQASNNNIHFIPPVCEEDLIREAIPFDVGIIPYEPVSLNNKYCCPNKLSQYMQAGLAIVHNNLPFVDKVVSSANCGVQYHGDTESFIQVINRLATNRVLLSTFQQNARQYANQEFHWEHYEPFFYKAFGLADSSMKTCRVNRY